MVRGSGGARSFRFVALRCRYPGPRCGISPTCPRKTPPRSCSWGFSSRSIGRAGAGTARRVRPCRRAGVASPEAAQTPGPRGFAREPRATRAGRRDGRGGSGCRPVSANTLGFTTCVTAALGARSLDALPNFCGSGRPENWRCGSVAEEPDGVLHESIAQQSRPAPHVQSNRDRAMEQLLHKVFR